MSYLIIGLARSWAFIIHMLFTGGILIFNSLKYLWRRSKILFISLIIVPITIISFLYIYTKYTHSLEKDIRIQQEVDKEKLLWEQSISYEKDCLEKKGNYWTETCSVLGARYYDGFGVKKDLNKAIKFSSMSCDIKKSGWSYPEACNLMGVIYRDDYKDYGKAYKYFDKGCDYGKGEACINLVELSKKYSLSISSEKISNSYRNACCFRNNYFSFCEKKAYKFIFPDVSYSCGKIQYTVKNR